MSHLSCSYNSRTVYQSKHAQYIPSQKASNALGAGAHFANDISIIQIRWKFQCSHPSCNEVITMKSCTWHDSTAVATCAKLCSNMIPYNGVTLKPIWWKNCLWNGLLLHSLVYGYCLMLVAPPWQSVLPTHLPPFWSTSGHRLPPLTSLWLGWKGKIGNRS